MEHLGSHWMDFHEIWYLIIFGKYVKKFYVIEIWKGWRLLCIKTDVHLWSYLAQFFLEWEMFQTRAVDKIKTHILYPRTFFQKSCHLWNNLEKYCRVRQATDDCIIGHRHIAWWLPKATHILRICNTYSFSTANMVTRKRFSIGFKLTLTVLL